MGINVGDIAPDFEAETTEGPLRFRPWNVGRWTVVFGFPRDLDGARLAEFGQLTREKAAWDAAEVQALGIGTPAARAEANWAPGTERSVALRAGVPLIADDEGTLGRRLGLIGRGVPGLAVIVLDARGVIRFIRHDPLGTTRNFAEVLEAIEVLRLGDRLRPVTPEEEPWTEADGPKAGSGAPAATRGLDAVAA